MNMNYEKKVSTWLSVIPDELMMLVDAPEDDGSTFENFGDHLFQEPQLHHAPVKEKFKQQSPATSPAANQAFQTPHHQMISSMCQPASLDAQSTPAKNDSLVPEVQNIVSTVFLGHKLNLGKIALEARNTEYNPKRFAAVIMRIRNPRTTALIFASGKMVCTGAKSEDESKVAMRKFARIIQKLGFPVKFLRFKIQNMVGSIDVKFPIRLEGLVLQHKQYSSYEPELFPGLIYRMVKPKIVLLIFVSGKMVITGAKVRAEIYKAFDAIYPVLKHFKHSKRCISPPCDPEAFHGNFEEVIQFL